MLVVPRKKLFVFKVLGQLLVVLLASSISLAALGPNDPVVVGQTFLAGSTDPTEGSTAWALTSHGVAEKLFTVDEHGEIIGQLATSVTKVSDFVWQVELQFGRKFSDGTTVLAQHVADSLTELNMVNSNAQSSLGSITATAWGDLMVEIESEQASQCNGRGSGRVGVCCVQERRGRELCLYWTICN